jgi:predicted AAA+ superfamily ATPase
MIEAAIQHIGATSQHCYFWATHKGAEIDLVIDHRNRLRGFEVKRTTAPRVTPSMRSALEDLGLTSIDVIHAGSKTFDLAPKIRAVAACRLLNDVKPLRH